MWASMTKIFYFLFTFRFLQVFAREEWIDPHDMKINVHSNYGDTMRQLQDQSNNGENMNYHEDITNKRQCACLNNGVKEYTCLIGVIGKIIDTVNFRRGSEKYEGRLNIFLNKEDYNFLEKIRSDSRNIEVRRFRDVLDDSVFIDDNPIFSIVEYIYLSLHHEYTILAICFIILLILIWKLEPHRYTFKTLFKLFLPFAYISDFVLRYCALIEEIEVDKYLQSKTYEKCDPNKLGWWDWIYDKFTGYCDENHRNFLLSQRASIHIITPMKVLAQQFDVVVPILKHLGDGLGKFMYALVCDAPWWMKPFVAILSFFLVIIMVLMMGSYYFDISTNINILHLIGLNFRHKNENVNKINNEKDCLSDGNLTLLLKSLNQSKNTVVLGRVNSPITFKTKKKNRETIRKNNKTNTPNNYDKNVMKEIACNAQTETTEEDKIWPQWGGGDQEESTCNAQTETEKTEEDKIRPHLCGGDQATTSRRTMIEFD